MRIAGVTIPSEKRLVISLSYIYGVGSTYAKVICKKAKISEDERVKNLTTDQEQKLREVLTGLGIVLEAD